MDNLTLAAYANSNIPENLNEILKLPQGAAGVTFHTLGFLHTPAMLPAELGLGQLSVKIYTSFFGPLPFANLALTQQTTCDYGQSFPGLVYLPLCGFGDGTGSDKTITPHEVAHQWWGQTVGFRGYRDQWMSEGFADESASIYLQYTRAKSEDYLDFWKQAHKTLTQKNTQGLRPIDVGPVTMGFRLSTEKTGWNVYEDLVYPKGAYILHMIRMMMWRPSDQDNRFAAMMRDFAQTYRLKAATTEDFKAMVEKHMTPNMDMDHNLRMDWFFNEYVYGTEVPNYHFESQVKQNGDDSTLHFKLTQSGVSPGFKVAVGLYLEMADGKHIHLGAIPIVGDSSIEHDIPLAKYPLAVKRAIVNYEYDVLSTEN